MASKVKRFIRMLAAWFKEKVEAADPSTYWLCLLNASYTFDYDHVWSDISATECSFKGYARVNLTSLGYTGVADVATAKARVQSLPATFAYDSGASGLTSEDAYAWALIEMSGSVENLLEAKNLASIKTFAGDTDFIPASHLFTQLNCDE